MSNLIHRRSDHKTGSTVEQLSNHLRLPALPWPARRLRRRFGLHAATAAQIAELIGYSMEARR